MPTSDDVRLAARLADAYGAMRDRCLAIGRSLTDEDAAATVPCCPAWTVHDLVAHMAGVAADIIDGRLDGVTTDEWTDAQVQARRGTTLADVCTEWAAKGPVVERMIRGGADFPPPFFIDAFTHEWDLRQAAGAIAAPDLSLLETGLPALIGSWGRRLDEAGLPAVDLDLGGTVRRVGSGDEVVTLAVDPFGFVRACMGRRSRRQLARLGWGSGAGEGHIDALLVFGVADVDIEDPALL